MKGKLAVAASLAVSCSVLLWVVLSQQSPSLADQTLPSTKSGQQALIAPEQVRPSSLTPRVDVHNESGSLAVLACDPHQEPVAGVALYWAPLGTTGGYSEHQLLSLGTTARDGRARLPRQHEGLLLGYAAGYGPAQCAVSPEVPSVDLVLQPGGTLRLKCVAAGDIPLSRVSVAIGRSLTFGLATGISTERTIPSAHPTRAVWNGVSDEQGIASWSNLPLARLIIQASHPDYVLFGISPEQVVDLSNKSQEAIAHFGAIYGVFFTLLDAAGANHDILSWQCVTPTGLGIPQLSFEDLRKRQRDLAANSNACCILWCCKHGSLDGIPNEAKVSVLTERSGWVSVQPQIRALRNLVTPEVIRFPERPGPKCVRTTIEIIDSEGARWPDERLEVKCTGFPSISCITGQPVVLPPGRYCVESGNGILSATWTETVFNVTSDTGTIVLPARVPLRRGSVKVTLDGTDTLDTNGMVFLTTEDHGTYSSQFKNGQITVLIPDGPVLCTVDVNGCQRAQQYWNVGKDTSTLHVRVAPR
jgi:hypothetical protein